MEGEVWDLPSTVVPYKPLPRSEIQTFGPGYSELPYLFGESGARFQILLQK